MYIYIYIYILLFTFLFLYIYIYIYGIYIIIFSYSSIVSDMPFAIGANILISQSMDHGTTFRDTHSKLPLDRYNPPSPLGVRACIA